MFCSFASFLNLVSCVLNPAMSKEVELQMVWQVISRKKKTQKPLTFTTILMFI